MRSQTVEAMNGLKGEFWFESVGKPMAGDVIQLRSWLHAVAHCAGVHWENTQLEGMNEIGAKVQRSSLERYQLWNVLVSEANAVVEPIVAMHIDHILQHERLPEIVRKRLFRDLRGLFMECEYGDIAVPGLFTYLAKVYRSGHFPCGWEGEYPKGRLVMY